MNYIKYFEQYDFYDEDWQKNLPEEFTIRHNQDVLTFKKRQTPNALPDQIQIRYDQKVWGKPDTLEFDIERVFDTNNRKLKLIISITYGDLEVSGFSIEPPNIVSPPFTYTSYGSKFDPSDTVFAFTDKSLRDFCHYINSFGHGIKINHGDLYFLHADYHES